MREGGTGLALGVTRLGLGVTGLVLGVTVRVRVWVSTGLGNTGCGHGGEESGGLSDRVRPLDRHGLSR